MPFFFSSNRHVAQLYNHISKIEWDYEAEPNQIRGSILGGHRVLPSPNIPAPGPPLDLGKLIKARAICR